MKIKMPACIAASLLAIHSSPSVADNWNEYLHLVQRYYFLDDQPVANVECRITSVPGGNEIKAQLKPIEKYIRVSENLDEFKVKYKKGVGVSVVEPKLVVTIGSTEGLSDTQLQRVQSGASSINRGAEQIFAAMKKIVEATVERYLLPRREEFVNLKVTESGRGALVEYTSGGENTKEEHSSDKVRLYSSSPLGEAEYVKYLSPLEDRLAISKVVLSGRMGDIKVTSESTIQFQKLDKLSFPFMVEEHSHLSGPSTNTDIRYSVKFDQCITY